MFILYPRQYRAKISDNSLRKRLSLANAHAAVPSSFGLGGAGAEDSSCQTATYRVDARFSMLHPNDEADKG